MKTPIFCLLISLVIINFIIASQKPKDYIKSIFIKALPEPEAGLAIGLFLGTQDNLDKDLKKAVSASGLSHILAVSGQHFSFWLAFLLPCFGFFYPEKKAYLFSILFLFAYLTLISFPPSAVRAFLQSLFAFSALLLRQEKNLWFFLVVSALISLLLMPKSLGSLSWQLSYLAVFGILFCQPFRQAIVIKNKVGNYVMDIIYLSISTQVFIAPLIINSFYRLPLISIFSNISVAWLVPLLLGSILLGLLLSMLLPFLSFIFFLPSYIFLHLFIIFAKLAAKTPLFISGPISPVFILIYYFLLLLIFGVIKNKLSRRRKLVSI
jgi:competence protein ComEC